MKKLIYIGLLKLKLLFKDRMAFLAALLAPIVFIGVIVLGNSNSGSTSPKYPIGLVNNDTGRYSKLLISALKKDKYFKVVESSLKNTEKDVKDGTVTMSFVIPENFSNTIENGNMADVEVIRLQENDNTTSFNMIIKNYVSQLVTSVKAKKATSSILTSMNLITAEEKTKIEDNVEKEYFKNINNPKNTYSVKTLQIEESHKKDNISTAAMGIIIMFVMFFVTLGAGSILEEKEIGTWVRILSTPTRNENLLGGYIFGNFIIGWVQVGILILSGKYIFGLSFGSSPLGLIMLFSAFLLAAIGLGTFLSSLVKTKAQLSTLAPIIVVPTCLLAGCMWPREIMPESMIKFSNFLPETWAIKGMADLITRNSGFSAAIVPSLVLLSFSLVFFILGAGLMKLQKD